MKKPFKIILIVLGILFVIYNLLGQTGIFAIYNNTTTANEPNIKLGSKLFTSNLTEPKNGDFICYKYRDEMLGEEIRVHRLCGMENDIIEIKDGTVFINGENIDKEINLVHFYRLTFSEYERIKNSEKITENSFATKVDENTIKILLEDNFALANDFASKRMIEPKEKIDNQINDVFGEVWNKDNFGPLTIPKDKIFIIGDSRDYSEDSRNIGLINTSDIVGVIIK